MALVTGRAFISLNGDRVRSKEGAELEPGGLEREAAMSDSGVDGHTSKYVPPRVAFKINHTSKTSLKELHAFTGTLTFETDSGRTYTLIEAFSAKVPKLVKGEVDLEYGGAECLED